MSVSVNELVAEASWPCVRVRRLIEVTIPLLKLPVVRNVDCQHIVACYVSFWFCCFTDHKNNMTSQSVILTIFGSYSSLWYKT